MQSQHTGKGAFRLQDYDKMSYADLLDVLQKIARASVVKLDHLPYALTADNLLKMVLVVS
jgi:hypothetical protein